MEKKRSKKKSPTWQCSKGCDLSKRACRHLESKLPSLKSGTFSAETRVEVADVLARDASTPTEQYISYEKQLKLLGFKDYEIELIMDRFISKLSIREITKKHGFTSTWVVIKLLGQISESLNRLHEVRRGQ